MKDIFAMTAYFSRRIGAGVKAGIVATVLTFAPAALPVDVNNGLSGDFVSSGLLKRAAAQTRACELTSTGAIPLGDLGTDEYLPGHIGGLYPDGLSTRPEAHEIAGLDIAENFVLPRDRLGAVDTLRGVIGMVSIGMSNTSNEFADGTRAFIPRTDRDRAVNPWLIVVNGAQSGKAADAWADPTSEAWNTLNQRVAVAGLKPSQVQVAWIKLAEREPANLGAFPQHAEVLQDHIEATARNLRARFPNLRMAYLSSRTRAWTDNPTSLNPEPFAYESGFAVRWAIEAQLVGDPSLDFDPTTGNAPWLSWGPYIWGDGEVPRSDGFVWLCEDVLKDFTHPSTSGIAKVANQLVAFFKTDPTAAPWFLRGTAVGLPPRLAAGADATAGTAPLTVMFSAAASDDDGTIAEFAWTFDDGTFSFDQNPVKTFSAPGLYEVPVTVSDNDGDTSRAHIMVAVDDGTGGGETGAPVITGPDSPLANGIFGQPYEAQFTASGDTPLRWQVIGGAVPAGMSLNRRGLYSGRPTQIGAHTFTVRVLNALGEDVRQITHTIVEDGGGGTETMLAPAADTYVRDGRFADSNFGAAGDLLVRGGGSGGNARTFLKFDLAGVGGSCTSATLTLTLRRQFNGAVLPVQALAVTDDGWLEAGMTWNVQPVSGPQLAAAAIDAAGVTATFDVTDFVATQASGDKVVSLALLDITNSGVRSTFFSREGAAPPRLDVVCN